MESLLTNIESVYNYPGPGYYETIDCFSHSPASPHKLNGRAAVTKEDRQIFKVQLKKATEQPGPGDYHILSEFGGYEPPQFKGLNISGISKVSENTLEGM